MNLTRSKLRSAMVCFLGAACLYAFPALAQSGSYDSEKNKLNEAISALGEANFFLARRNIPAAKAKIRVAYFRTKISVVVLQRDYRLGDAVAALEVAEAKLGDDGLRLDDQIRIGVDCISIGLKRLILATNTPIEGLKELLDLALNLNQQAFFYEVVSVLEDAREMAYRQRQQQAANAIGVAIEKAEDRFLRLDEKQYYVQDCIQVALLSLRVGPPPHVPPHHPSQGFVEDRHCASGRGRISECVFRAPIVGVEVLRVHSVARCNQGRTYGVRGNVLWVDRGCRADFRVYMKRN